MKTLRKKTLSLFIHISVTLAIIAFLLVLTACSSSRPKPATDYIPTNYLAKSSLIDFDRATLCSIPNNAYAELSVPTYVTKVLDTYFIVDCYHNQVIYNENLTDPLYEWKLMTSDMRMGHTLASDGEVYMIDDTENNRILIMEKDMNENGQPIFVPTQEFTEVGNRPHYIIYDEYTDTFYAWSSQSGEMFLFRHAKEDTRMYLTKVLSIPSLNGVYVRSFTIIDNHIFFVSGNSSIIEADLYSFQVVKEYPVPAQMAGMIQISLIDDYYYITVSTDNTGNQDYATLLRTKSLSDLSKGNYEDIYSNFIGGGTPYYISKIDDAWYLTEHRLPGHSIWRFKVNNNEITDVTSVY